LRWAWGNKAESPCGWPNNLWEVRRGAFYDKSVVGNVAPVKEHPEGQEWEVELKGQMWYLHIWLGEKEWTERHTFEEIAY
jgi:hypothetical protein